MNGPRVPEDLVVMTSFLTSHQGTKIHNPCHLLITQVLYSFFHSVNQQRLSAYLLHARPWVRPQCKKSVISKARPSPFAAMFADLGHTHFTSQTLSLFLHHVGELGLEQSLEII